MLDPSVKPVISDLFKVLSHIEGGGLSLHTIVTEFSAKSQIESLKVKIDTKAETSYKKIISLKQMLVVNMAVWGSRSPAGIYLSRNAYEKPNFFHHLAMVKKYIPFFSSSDFV